MRALAHLAFVIALAAGLAAVLSMPANAQQYPPPEPDDAVLQADVREIPQP